ncbi:C4-dicarboxylate transporter DctA [Chitinophaga ginsengisoli]|uniref:Aerobic C4-dicarboxylate transport protein n=1 Tax=Chitinophaga ginsengisoli TaxID=363837 RepID=A0A2P8FCV8_9BACT|nr:C4-dicarboxylate transporter DctA [Chitinophaga ginsengisoli]PSL19559.1 aerobic C4-dicarboxylate transport protein [Chitinophaga ginsengisoli]
MSKLYRHLYFQVVVAIVLGILAGALFPSIAATGKLMSEMFINLIKMLIAPIIFLTIVLGIARMGDMKKVGRVGGKAILYFEIITTLAIAIGLLVANQLKPGVGEAFQKMNTAAVAKYQQQAEEFKWSEFLMHIVPSNVIDSFAKGDILQVLIFAVLFGYGVTRMNGAGNSLLATFEKLSEVFFNILKFIMRLAPLGAFGGMAYTIGSFGLESLYPMLKLMGCVYLTMLLFIGVVLAGIARIYRFSLWHYLKFIRNEILIVLGTSSSESALPGLMARLEELGCARQVVGLVVPAGYSFNLDGTSIYLSMAVIFLAQVYGVNLDIWQELTIIGILMITSKGAAGITGSGFIVLASTLTAIKVIPIEGLGILIGVDRFMSEARAITNLIGNGVATIVMAKSENAFDEGKYQAAVGIGRVHKTI